MSELIKNTAKEYGLKVKDVRDAWNAFDDIFPLEIQEKMLIQCCESSVSTGFLPKTFVIHANKTFAPILETAMQVVTKHLVEKAIMRVLALSNPES